ncbi:hypothetical protein WN944_003217 [Citrus x changshan-huyou]|uniref:Uncharacterized protein n=1 Tax=Citrus x changshan-huyou TaxID=2935761 RepID=A0AAP0QHS3_9ROSI
MVASRWARFGAKEADGEEERTEAATKVGRSQRVLGGAPLVTARMAAADGSLSMESLSLECIDSSGEQRYVPQSVDSTGDHAADELVLVILFKDICLDSGES